MMKAMARAQDSDTVALDTPTLNAKDSEDLTKQDGGALRVKELGSLDLSNDLCYSHQYFGVNKE
jgi:hypothetical protein